MEWTNIITNPFVIGLGVGLFLAVLTWFSAALNQRRLRAELRELKNHLNRQMSLTAKGHEEQQKEVESLKKQNENLRITVNTLQQKPGRTEIRTLHVYDNAINLMQKRAPGFAPVWQEVLAESEQEMTKNEGGFGKLLKKVFRPGQLPESAEDKGPASEDDTREGKP